MPAFLIGERVRLEQRVPDGLAGVQLNLRPTVVEHVGTGWRIIIKLRRKPRAFRPGFYPYVKTTEIRYITPSDGQSTGPTPVFGF